MVRSGCASNISLRSVVPERDTPETKGAGGWSVSRLRRRRVRLTVSRAMRRTIQAGCWAAPARIQRCPLPFARLGQADVSTVGRAPSGPRMPGGLDYRTARLRRHRRAAVRHELVVRLGAPQPRHPALATRQRGPLLRPLLAWRRAGGHRRRVRVSLPAPAGAHRRRVDAAVPRRSLGDPPAAKGGAERSSLGHAARPGRPLPLGGGPPRAKGRGARLAGAAPAGERRAVARFLLRAAPPRLRPLPARAGAGTPVRALRRRPG